MNYWFNLIDDDEIEGLWSELSNETFSLYFI